MIKVVELSYDYNGPCNRNIILQFCWTIGKFFPFESDNEQSIIFYLKILTKFAQFKNCTVNPQYLVFTADFCWAHGFNCKYKISKKAVSDFFVKFFWQTTVDFGLKCFILLRGLFQPSTSLNSERHF